MEKPVNINGKELTFKCSAAIPRMYRKEYNADLFADFKYISEIPEGDMDSKAWEIIENIAYLMYKHAQKDQENVPSIDEWLSQFDFTALQQMMPVIVELWTIDQKTTSTPKKEKGQ